MSKLLRAISDASMDVVEVADIEFRVRKICSSHLAKVGMAALAVATPEMAEKAETDDNDVSKMMNSVTPKQAEHLAQLQDATVCAGLVSIRDVGADEWEPITVVMDPAKEDIDADRVWVGSLPAGVVEKLFQTIMSLSTDRGDAAERLKSFRGGRSRDSTGSPPRGEGLREVAT